MNKTLFPQYVEAFMPKLDAIIEKINGKRPPPTYLHKQRLRTEYSADQKWESASVNTTYVAADVVALDSPLPIKQRPTLSHASGKLPKVAMKKTLNETQIGAINVMIAQGQSYENVARKLIADADACAAGIDEINEYNRIIGSIEPEKTSSHYWMILNSILKNTLTHHLMNTLYSYYKH